MAVAQLVEALLLQAEKFAGSTPRLGSLGIFIPVPLWLWGYHLKVKVRRCVGLTLTLPPSCADCLEILGGSTYWILLKGLSRDFLLLESGGREERQTTRAFNKLCQNLDLLMAFCMLNKYSASVKYPHFSTTHIA